MESGPMFLFQIVIEDYLAVFWQKHLLYSHGFLLQFYLHDAAVFNSKK